MKEIHLYTKDNGSSIQADTASTIIISLEANPTTGYTWAIDKIDANILQNMQSGFKTADTTAAGAAGQQYFTFKASKKGNCKLSLKYKRQWESDTAIVKTFEIDLNVV